MNDEGVEVGPRPSVGTGLVKNEEEWGGRGAGRMRTCRMTLGDGAAEVALLFIHHSMNVFFHLLYK